MAKLNAREQRILEFLQAQIKENGYPPTVRDICAELDIRSTSTVHKALGRLAEEGYISKGAANKRRAVKLIGADIAEASSAKLQELRSDVVEIPVVGQIAAGTPVLAEQNIEDSFPLPARYLSHGTSFMLRVHGESMIEAGIFDGDYILVHQQNTANNGDIVAAMVDGMESEATVKTFYKENGHIRLQPQNSSMAPIIVPDCTILGVVKGVFRWF